MSFSKVIRREIEVAISKHSQPVWFRILKYIVLGFFLYFFWGNPWLWIFLMIMFVFAMFLHFWYRYKTQGWTKSYGMWEYRKSKYD